MDLLRLVRNKIVSRNLLMLGSMLTINVIIGCYVVLTIIDVQTTDYIALVVPLLAVLVNNIMLAKHTTDLKNQAQDNTEKIEQVEKQTNGRLDKKFQELADHITETVKEAK